jgi:SAM-dependent methyltransferase
MSQDKGERNYYAQTYDASVPDWPGEIDFYRDLAAQAKSKGGAVLEVACGTGRVAMHLLRDGVRLVGLDLSPDMLDVVRQKSAAFPNARWVEADMRSFDLGETFELVIIPGHAFHNLTTAQDQMASLECIKRHLTLSGRLVLHLDHQHMGWLGDLCGAKGGVFEAAEQFEHPQTGRQVRTLRAWSYERSTQTAIAQTKWEELGPDGQVVDRRDTGPYRLHCYFRFEVQHLLARTGFAVEALYGDFWGNELRDDSSEMVWVASNQPASPRAAD